MTIPTGETFQKKYANTVEYKANVVNIQMIYIFTRLGFFHNLNNDYYR